MAVTVNSTGSLYFIANEPVTDRLEFYNLDGDRDPSGDFVFVCELKPEPTSPSLENMDAESLKEIGDLILEIQGGLNGSRKEGRRW